MFIKWHSIIHAIQSLKQNNYKRKLYHNFECKNIWSSWTQTLRKQVFLPECWLVKSVCKVFYVTNHQRFEVFRCRYMIRSGLWLVVRIVGHSEWYRSEAAVPRRHCLCVWKLEDQPSTTLLILTAETEKNRDIKKTSHL